LIDGDSAADTAPGMKRIIAGLLALLVVFAARPAAADEATEREVRALFKEANQKLEGGEYVEALELYRTAYDKIPNIKILLNMATALRQLGRHVEAAEAYEKYLADPSSDLSKRDEVRKIITSLEARLGTLRIEIDQPAATLNLDGKSFHDVPPGLTVRVEVGEHSLVASKEGFSPTVVTASVRAGEHRTLTMRLAAVRPPEVKRAVVPPRPVEEEAVARPDEEAPEGEAPRTRPRSRHRPPVEESHASDDAQPEKAEAPPTAAPAPDAPKGPSLVPGIVVGILALGAVGAGTGLILSVGSDLDTLQQTCKLAVCDTSGLQTKAYAGYAMFGVAAAAAIVDVVLWVVFAKRRRATTAYLAPAGAGFIAGGRF
jgi:hypothetical protein